VSLNNHRPHVLVLPDRELANEFKLNLDQSVQTRIHVDHEAGGWIKVLDCFESEHIVRMNRYPNRFMVLVIDFDGNAERRDNAMNRIPEHLRDRVFILGALSEPEDLKRALGSCETIGSALAKDCREETAITWSHEILRHNAGELGRLRDRVRPILFPA